MACDFHQPLTWPVQLWRRRPCHQGVFGGEAYKKELRSVRSNWRLGWQYMELYVRAIAPGLGDVDGVWVRCCELKRPDGYVQKAIVERNAKAAGRRVVEKTPTPYETFLALRRRRRVTPLVMEELFAKQ
jgi:hypothetical protein